MDVIALPAGRQGHPLAKAKTWDELRDATWV
jgi:hypothetical protein